MITEKQKSIARSVALCIDNFDRDESSQEKLFEVMMDGEASTINDFMSYITGIFGVNDSGRSHLNILHNNKYDKFVLTIPTALRVIVTAVFNRDKLTVAVRSLEVSDADPKEFPNPGLAPVYFDEKVLLPYHLFIELSQISNETPYYNTIDNVVMSGDRYKFITKSVVISESDFIALTDRYVMFKKEGY